MPTRAWPGLGAARARPLSPLGPRLGCRRPVGPPFPLPSDTPFPAGGLWPPTGPLSFPPPPRRWPPGRLRGPPLPQGFSSYTRAAARLLRGGLHTYIHTYTHTVLPWMVCGCVLCVLHVTRLAPPLSQRCRSGSTGGPRAPHGALIGARGALAEPRIRGKEGRRTRGTRARSRGCRARGTFSFLYQYIRRATALPQG